MLDALNLKDNMIRTIFLSLIASVVLYLGIYVVLTINGNWATFIDENNVPIEKFWVPTIFDRPKLHWIRLIFVPLRNIDRIYWHKTIKYDNKCV